MVSVLVNGKLEGKMYQSVAVASISNFCRLIQIPIHDFKIRGCSPVAKQPKVIVAAELIYLLLMIRHVGVVQDDYESQTLKCCP